MGFLKKFNRRPPASATQLGRNDPCWCGSGKKYKQCHLKSDQKYISRALDATCNRST
jgi:hypothetical protein